MNDQNTLSELIAQGRVEEFLQVCKHRFDLPSVIQAEQAKWQRVSQKLECIQLETFGWQYLKIKEKTVRVRTRRGKDSFEFNMRTEISAVSEAIIAIINETKKYPQIIPFCNSAEVLKVISPCERQVLIQNKVPFLDSRFLKVRIAKLTSPPVDTIIFAEGVPVKDSKTYPGSEIKLNTLVIRLAQEEKNMISLTVYALLDEALSYLPNLLISKLIQLGVTRFLEQIHTLPRPSL